MNAKYRFEQTSKLIFIININAGEKSMACQTIVAIMSAAGDNLMAF